MLSLLSLLAVGLLAGCCCGLPIPVLGPEPEYDLTISPTELPEAEVGRPYQVAIVVSDNDTPVGDMFIESGTLPPGLTLTFPTATDTAEISGTPEEAGTFEFVVGAWCFGTNVSGDTGEQVYTLVVR
jgi:hypothetical protein